MTDPRHCTIEAAFGQEPARLAAANQLAASSPTMSAEAIVSFVRGHVRTRSPTMADNMRQLLRSEGRLPADRPGESAPRQGNSLGANMRRLLGAQTGGSQ